MFQVGAGSLSGNELEMIAGIVGLVIAVVLHEVAHGVVAMRLGDPTAYYAGRLTLNPIKHVDLWGTILFPLLQLIATGRVLMAWAKPVPVNYYNLQKGRFGPVIVALAGPITNFFLLVFFAVMARFAPEATAFPLFFREIALVNGFLMLFNLIPLPPLDGSKVLYLFLEDRPDIIQNLERYSLFILVFILMVGSGFISNLVVGPTYFLVNLFSGIGIDHK